MSARRRFRVRPRDRSSGQRRVAAGSASVSMSAPIKRMLVAHRGLSGEHRMLACEWLCYMKSEHLFVFN